MRARWCHRGLERWLPVLVVAPILLLDGVLSHRGDPVGWLAVVSTLVAVAPLLVIDRLPLWTGFLLLIGGVVLVLAVYEPGTTVVLLPAWALFDLARHRGRRQTVIAAIAVIPAVIVSIIPFTSSAGEAVSLILRNLALCELALAVGYVLWHSRETVDRETADAQRRLGEERLRIAREVHDVVAHSIVAINVQSGVAAHLLDRDPEQARDALQAIRRTSGDALADLRATLGILREPEADAPVAPAAGLDDLDDVAAPLRAGGVDVTLSVDTPRPLPAPVHAAAYRIVQEALTHVLRHASATRADVTVRLVEDDWREAGERVTITVADDGAGGENGASTGAGAGAGAGVRGMRERAAALGGTMEAGPVPGGGWRVRATLPLSPADVPA